MAGQHTPGPWKYTAVTPLVSSASGRKVARVVWTALADFPGASEQQPVDEANGHLIAAAPEMLAALHSIAACWNRHQTHAAMVNALDYIAHTADEAIAKAEGRRVVSRG